MMIGCFALFYMYSFFCCTVFVKRVVTQDEKFQDGTYCYYFFFYLLINIMFYIDSALYMRQFLVARNV